MATELDDLLERSTALAHDLGGDEALGVNADILDVATGHPIATNRLGIGLAKRKRYGQAIEVLELGLRIHPGNAIMVKRLSEARRLQAQAPGGPGSAGGATGPWTEFDPQELVDSSLAGPGREACIRLCAESIRMSEAIDLQWTAVTPVKSGRRFRVIGGIFTGVAPWREYLSVAVPSAAKALIRQVQVLGGQVSDEPAKAVPCVELFVPRGRVEELLPDLLPAHQDHLRLSLEYGPPTHLDKHHPELRRYLLDRAAVPA